MHGITRHVAFRQILDALPAAVYTTDAEGCLTHFNREAARLAGREPVVGGERWSIATRLLHPDGRPMPLEESPLAIALRERRPVQGVQAVLERPDGSRVAFEAHSTPLFDERGELIGGIDLLLEVADRKAGDSALARLAAIVESSQDAIVSKDLDGIITSWNAGARRMFGYEAAEAIGRPITMLMPPERVDEEQDILRRIRRGERMEHYETVRRRKDGRLLDVSLSVSPLRDPAGRVVGASKIARDITERKRAEEALKDADRRKDEFLAVLAHELRNPLAPILNAMSILQIAGRDAETWRQTREMMDRQLSLMARLIDDLLDVSRIRQGKIELRKERVDLSTLAGHAVETVRAGCDRKGVELSVTLPARPVHVECDSARIVQAIGNLLQNACKFTERGGSIRLALAREGAVAVVRVQDDGIGIAPEQLTGIFEMYAQGGAGIDRTQGGLGIGLTLAKRLVEMHGGTLSAASAGLGLGAEFVVRLPAVEIPEPPPPDDDGSDPAAKPAVSRSILVVDDNRDAADSLALLLKISGHRVHTAHDGLEAVEKAASVRPEVVLLDLGLPKLNGYEAARLIRKQAGGAPPTIVALTGLSREKDRLRSKEAGFDAYLIKPVSLASLSELLGAS